jgi:syntaxin 1A
MFRVADLANAQETLASMEARQAEIRKIESSVNELHQLFIETSALVDKQGIAIKRLSEHVNATEAFTEQAVIQTEQAVEKKKSIRKVSSPI